MTYDELRSVVEAVENRDVSALTFAHGDCQGLQGRNSQRAQARPGSTLQAVAPTGSQLQIASFTWGFPIDGGKKTVFNTRIESALAGSRMWARAMRDGRCILPVASFFEPHATETAINPRTGRPVKRQYEFFADGHDCEIPLLLASIHDGERLSVVTTEPNASMAPVHPRMPLVLRFEEVLTWLHGDYASLVDRSGLALAAVPEQPESPELSQSTQLSLFS